MFDGDRENKRELSGSGILIHGLNAAGAEGHDAPVPSCRIATRTGQRAGLRRSTAPVARLGNDPMTLLLRSSALHEVVRLAYTVVLTT
jgi:hypothetical protein